MGRALLTLVSLCLLSASGAAGSEPHDGRVGAVAGDGAAQRAAAAGGVAPTIRELVGQKLVVAMHGTSPSPGLLARIRRGEIGGIILFGGNVESRSGLARSVAALQGAARAGGRPPLLIAVDQEGGAIRRLPWVGPSLSTSELGRLGRARIESEARRAGLGLRAAGVNLDFAPVADVPAAGSFMELERRTFATNAGDVASAATAFAKGLAAARVAAAVKHFPGIGRATRNTDRTAVALPVTSEELARADLLPFRRAIAAGVPLVMISNATYPALDAKPAPWSPRLQALLRNELRFKGVTITDALEGAAATRGRAVSDVAGLAAQAGVDLLLLTGSEASSNAVFESVLGVAERGAISASSLRRSHARILALKKAFA